MPSGPYEKRMNLNKSLLLQLYKSMVLPILECGNVIWGPHYELDQRELEGAQWRATKLVATIFKRRVLHWSTNIIEFTIPVRVRRGDLIFSIQTVKWFFWTIAEYSNFLHYLTTHIPEVIHLNYLSHLPIIYIVSTFLALGWLMTAWNNLTSDIVTNSLVLFLWFSIYIS